MVNSAFPEDATRAATRMGAGPNAHLSRPFCLRNRRSLLPSFYNTSANTQSLSQQECNWVPYGQLERVTFHDYSGSKNLPSSGKDW